MRPRIIFLLVFQVAALTCLGQLSKKEILYFDHGKRDLTTVSRNTVDHLFKEVNPEQVILINLSGHTDSDGSDSYNLILSQQRVDIVQRYLLSKGITIEKVSAHHYGKSQPIASNNSSEGKQKNRRVEIFLSFENYGADTNDNMAITTGKETTPCGSILQLTEKEILYFNYGEHELTITSKRVIDELLKKLSKYTIVQIDLSGHTDSDGSIAFNQKLSQERVVIVQQYFSRTGIAQERFNGTYFGKSKPIASNLTEAGKQKNRRVEMIIKFNDCLDPLNPLVTTQEQPSGITKEKIIKEESTQIPIIANSQTEKTEIRKPGESQGNSQEASISSVNKLEPTVNSGESQSKNENTPNFIAANTNSIKNSIEENKTNTAISNTTETSLPAENNVEAKALALQNETVPASQTPQQPVTIATLGETKTIVISETTPEQRIPERQVTDSTTNTIEIQSTPNETRASQNGIETQKNTNNLLNINELTETKGVTPKSTESEVHTQIIPQKSGEPIAAVDSTDNRTTQSISGNSIEKITTLPTQTEETNIALPLATPNKISNTSDSVNTLDSTRNSGLQPVVSNSAETITTPSAQTEEKSVPLLLVTPVKKIANNADSVTSSAVETSTHTLVEETKTSSLKSINYTVDSAKTNGNKSATVAPEEKTIPVIITSEIGNQPGANQSLPANALTSTTEATEIKPTYIEVTEEKMVHVNFTIEQPQQTEVDSMTTRRIDSSSENQTPLGEVQTFIISGNDQFTIVGEHGTTVTFPKNSLVDRNGQLVNDTVTVTLQEVYTKADMINSNIQTTSDGKLLESGGMANVTVTSQNSEEVFLNKDSSYELGFPTQTKKQDMQLFYGEHSGGGVNWVTEKTVDDSTFSENKNSLDNYVFKSSKLGWTNVDRFVGMNELEKTNLRVNPGDIQETNVCLVFKRLNSVLNITNKKNEFLFSHIPIGEEATLVAFSKKGDQIFYASKSITIDRDQSERLVMEKLTEAEFQQRIKEFN